VSYLIAAFAVALLSFAGYAAWLRSRRESRRRALSRPKAEPDR
jgi:hypothetical protein